MLATIPDFNQARIIVVGDVMLDRYWSGSAERISPEAPVPVVTIQQTENRVGGAGNVALNIAKLGAKVTLLGVIGKDEEGAIIEQLLSHAGVDCDFVHAHQGFSSLCKLRVLAQHQQLIRLDFEQTPLLFDEIQLAAKLEHYLTSHPVVVFSDYGKGTLSDVSRYIAQAKAQGRYVLVDPKGTDYTRYCYADIITPNMRELQAVVGACTSEELLFAKGRQLLQQQHINHLLCTRGESGMTLINEQHVHSLPAQAKDVFDVTGAGDTVIAVMASAVALGTPLIDAMYLANLAGGIVVGKLGTSTVSIAELTRALHGDRHSFYGCVGVDELKNLMIKAKVNGERIIMTNGCFDLLHAGHVSYLQQARELGDRLIVAVNSDASVKRLKGEARPINALEQRMTVLAALACVDWVVAFEEDTPEQLYCQLLPDVIVKGGDYRPEEVAGADCVIQAGGEVKILSFVEGQSTTAMINKAKG